MSYRSNIAVVDVGKTNKKLLVFDPGLRVLHEASVTIPETTDEDGYPCEDIALVTDWLKDAVGRVIVDDRLNVGQLNFSGYGASFVHLDHKGEPVTPLYNYLKPFPEAVKDRFETAFGPMERMAVETSSPVLGHLNSGLQLYRLKLEHPQVFARIRYSLHLPQYLSWVFTGEAVSDLTSVGCHTMLWDFSGNGYHRWVLDSGLSVPLAPLVEPFRVREVSIGGRSIRTGYGIHDSSAALIPYLRLGRGKFMLLSTGTWSVTLNPFNDRPLTGEDLQKDCLCYLTPQGRQVKASRLFAGPMHEEGVARIGEQFNLQPGFFHDLKPDDRLLGSRQQADVEADAGPPEVAYHHLMRRLVDAHVSAIGLVSSADVQQLYVDGGFGKNPVFMRMLALALPNLQVFAAAVPQASAIGAAMAVDHDLPSDAVGLVSHSEFR